MPSPSASDSTAAVVVELEVAVVVDPVVVVTAEVDVLDDVVELDVELDVELKVAVDVDDVESVAAAKRVGCLPPTWARPTPAAAAKARPAIAPTRERRLNPLNGLCTGQSLRLLGGFRGLPVQSRRRKPKLARC